MADWFARMWSFATARGRIRAGLAREGQIGDGREDAALKTVLEKAERNSDSVLRTIDGQAKRSWLMNIGDQKGAILAKTVTGVNPTTVLELGAYVDYSATLIGSKLGAGSKLISVEKSARNVEIARKVVDHAGLADKVEFVVGTLSERLEDIKKLLHQQNRETFEFVLIDHDKDAYLSDLMLLKSNGMVGKGTILFADNMKMPGAPSYRDYINQHKDEYESGVQDNR